MIDFDDKKEQNMFLLEAYAEDDGSDDSSGQGMLIPGRRYPARTTILKADFTTSVPSSPASIAAEPPQTEWKTQTSFFSYTFDPRLCHTVGSRLAYTGDCSSTKRLSLDDNDLLDNRRAEATTPSVKSRNYRFSRHHSQNASNSSHAVCAVKGVDATMS